ncbi:hypothetical protein WJX79_006536 [Trebouxia sp. C0005]
MALAPQAIALSRKQMADRGIRQAVDSAKQAVLAGRGAKRMKPEEQEYEDDFVVDDEEEPDWRQALKSITKYDPSKFDDRGFDDRTMEANYKQIQAEERRSARLGREDDRRAEEEELREQEEKRKKKKRARATGGKSQDFVAMLGRATALKTVDTAALEAIVQQGAEEELPANYKLAGEGLAPEACHFLLSHGTFLKKNSEAYQAPVGTVINLKEVLLHETCSSTVSLAAATKVFTVKAAAFRQVLQDNPGLEQALFRDLSQQLTLSQTTVQEQQLRSQALQPFIVAPPSRGIVGTSRFAQRMKAQVMQAAKDPTRRPTLIFGEPGLEKDNIAAQIHYRSSKHQEWPIARFDCSKLDSYGSQLFGRGSKQGLLHWVGQGTLLLTNVHKVKPSVVPLLQGLLTEGTFQASSLDSGAASSLPGGGEQGKAGAVEECAARLVFTSEKPLPWLEKLATQIKVAPLRVRPADVADLQKLFVRGIAKSRGQGSLALTPEAVLQLESYSFPGNIKELQAIVSRAALQSPESAQQLPEEVFWFATQPKDRLKWNLLSPGAFPWLKPFLRSDFWPHQLNHNIIIYVYTFIVAVLFLGPQDRPHNFALTAFWGYWWPGIFLVYPFLGRIWCSICPFMIYGEVVQKWRLAKGATLRKWPHAAVEQWGGWFLLALFGAILTWEEVWDLPNSAALSAWLLLLITAGAMICSWFFERRLWCRHLCPIGGMNGMFAKLSMTELRSRQGVCSGNCSTYTCYKGGPAEPPEGIETGGCPLYSHPAQLSDNRNCVLCMTCLKACPHKSVELRLRFPGTDLWSGHKALQSEVSLMFLLLGAVYVHHLPQLLTQLGINPLLLDTNTPAHILATVTVLTLPGAAAAATDGLMRLFADRASDRPKAKPFLETSYSYMPLVWGATLAFWLGPALQEGGHILPIATATIGWDSSTWMPTLEPHPAVISFLQHSTLLAGAGSFDVSRGV